ncbi:MAG: nucleotidyl transferase AbiEii/AbiGii toxin family protein [Pseudonocardia sp.]
MELDRDFSEFIACCAAREVRFLVVGGYALAAHGHPRYTKDLDIWLRLDPDNARRLIDALADFGFGSLGLTVADFAEPGTVVQLGRAPKRIDLLTTIDGVTFEECWPVRVEIDIDGAAVPFIDVDHLVVNKRASGRTQDLADAETLAGR